MRSTTQDLVAARYNRRIHALVQSALQAGASTVAEIAPLLPGVFPVTVAQLIPSRKATAKPALDHNARRHRKSNRLVAHPLDFDWRFADRALERLASETQQLDGWKRGVACLGCPSVAQHFAATHGVTCDNRDLNLAAPHGWNAFERCKQPITAGVVVMDPPWYGPYFREFLWSVRINAERGTDVLMAAPPWGTRPGCREEMRRLIAAASRMGFAVVAYHECVLPYVTPLFEMNVLRAHNLDDVPLTWRRADLWHLRLISNGNTNAPRAHPPRDVWEERRFGDVRIKIRIGSSTRPGGSKLVPLGRRGILTSVSSRDPLRRQANVVTTGGRHFISRNPHHFLHHTCLLDSRNPQTPAQRQLTALIADEQAEIDRYYDLVDAFDHA